MTWRRDREGALEALGAVVRESLVAGVSLPRPVVAAALYWVEVEGRRPKKRDTTGNSNGGKARAESLSPERRREIARLASAARWTGRDDVSPEDRPRAEDGSVVDVSEIPEATAEDFARAKLVEPGTDAGQELLRAARLLPRVDGLPDLVALARSEGRADALAGKDCDPDYASEEERAAYREGFSLS